MATVKFFPDNTEWKFAVLSRTNFRLIQKYNWPKNNFDEIHVSPKGDTGRLPLTSIILSWNQGIRHFEVAREPGSRWFQSALWDCFGGRIFNMAANLSPKTVPQCTLTTNSTRSPAQPQSGEYGMHRNETFRTNEERYGHFRIKERRFDCCSSSDDGIYWVGGIISKLAPSDGC